MHLFKWHHTVAFSDTDMAGIVHFSNYYRYMENAEHAMFRSMGSSIHMPGDKSLRWPRVHTSCDYKKPLSFEDEIDVYIFVKAQSQKTVEYLMPIKKVKKSGEEVVAVGRMIVACCKYSKTEGRMRAVAIPKIWARALKPCAPGNYSEYL